MPEYKVIAMHSIKKLHNQKGSTLIEAMVAIAVLTVGIMATMVMQAKAIQGSSTAMNRTEANNISIALLETLKNLPFTNDNLAQTTATVPELNLVANQMNSASAAAELQNLINTPGKVRTFIAADFPEMQALIRLPAGAAAGTVVDQSRISYRLAWAVQDQVLAGVTLNKTIRVFMTWNSPMGINTLQMNTIKYNNVSLAI
jgi:type IV pilus assembly protein PilV